MRRYLPFILIAGGLALGLGTGLLLFFVERYGDPFGERGIGDLSSAAPGAAPPHTQGNADAPTTLEAFSDFQCEPCRKLYREIKRLQADYGSSVRFVFRQFPLPSMHRNAFEAARASEAAALQGHFWEMHDQLFENQAEWSTTVAPRLIFARYARALGLDVERFRRDMDGPQVDERVLADLGRGKSIQIKGTPVVFLAGRLVSAQAMTFEAMRKMIEATFERKGSRPRSGDFSASFAPPSRLP